MDQFWFFAGGMAGLKWAQYMFKLYLELDTWSICTAQVWLLERSLTAWTPFLSKHSLAITIRLSKMDQKGLGQCTDIYWAPHTSMSVRDTPGVLAASASGAQYAVHTCEQIAPSGFQFTTIFCGGSKAIGVSLGSFCTPFLWDRGSISGSSCWLPAGCHPSNRQVLSF